MDTNITKRVVRAVMVMILIIASIALCTLLLPLLYPFLLAWIIAALMNPIVNLLENRLRFPRWLAVTLSLSVFVTSLFTVLAAVITRIVKEIMTLTETIQLYLQAWRELLLSLMNNEYIVSIIDTLSMLYKDNPNIQNTINTNISRTAETVTTTVTDLVTNILNGIVTLLSRLPNIATISVVVLLAAFFISKDWRHWLNIVTDWFPDQLRKPAYTIWTDLKKALLGYLRAQFILISITAVVITIGLLLLGVPYAVTIGLLIGLVDLLPYLGVGAVMVPWIMYSFITDPSSLAIGLTILYAIVLIARQIIEPKVLASSIGLDPLMTLVAMFVGLNLFGVLGLIIGPVTLILLTAVHRAHVFRDVRNYIMIGRK
ncbi:sporulation integral membrane protein YtvI [Paenibacillus assamensis]|uniref:sporulation integral membrane protein YtvI n=1 Tax=Paenibacillus assamensis TaxID=311244 RepID=UPI00048BFC64|nr:sporulation integral membrane protein YtvI [Paenibacillus assamensis]